MNEETAQTVCMMDFGNFCGLRTGFPAVDTTRRVSSFLPTDEAAVRASTAREFVRGATTQVAPSSHLSRLRGCWACRQRPSLRCCCCSDAHPRGHRTQGNCRRLQCWRRSTSNPEGASGLKKTGAEVSIEPSTFWGSLALPSFDKMHSWDGPLFFSRTMGPPKSQHGVGYSTIKSTNQSICAD